MSPDHPDQLIAQYVRDRAHVEVPPDLLAPVRAGIAETPQAHRSWFIAQAPAGIAVAAVAVVIALAVIIGLRPGPIGPSPGGSGLPSPTPPSGSSAPSADLGHKPMLQAEVREASDAAGSITYYLGRLDGTVFYTEQVPADQLSQTAWFGPFGETFVRVGVEAKQWTVDLLTTTDPTPRRILTDNALVTAATASSDGAWVYLARADTAGTDLGIWRLPATGGDLAQVLGPDAQRPATPRLSGNVFYWTPDGTQLLVQHCRGARVPGDDCTWTRVRSETSEVLGEVSPSAPAGIMVGLANDRLLAGADCDGLSCTASVVDFATGEVTDVDAPHARETLIESSAGPILLTDQALRDAYQVTATELDSGRSWTVPVGSAVYGELVTLEAYGAIQLDPGWFAVASEGQLGVVHPLPAILVNAVDGQEFVVPTLGAQPTPASATPAPSGTLSPALPQGTLDLAQLGWQTVVPELDPNSQATIGHWLAVGTLDSGTPTWFQPLAESPWQFQLFADQQPVVDGPTAGRVLFVSDNGQQSTIQLIDIHGTARTTIATTNDVVFGARMAPDGKSAYLVLLDRGTGRDQGVFRVDVGGDGSPHLVMASPSVDTAQSGAIRLVAVQRFVRILRISPDGNDLVRLACGEPFGGCVLDLLQIFDGQTFHLNQSLQTASLVAVGDGLIVGGGTCESGGGCWSEGIGLARGMPEQLVGNWPVVDSEGHLVMLSFGPVTEDVHQFSATQLDGSGQRLVFTTDGSVRPMDFSGTGQEATRVELPWGWVGVFLDGHSASGDFYQMPAAVRLSDGGWVALTLPAIAPVGGGHD